MSVSREAVLLAWVPIPAKGSLPDTRRRVAAADDSL